MTALPFWGEEGGATVATSAAVPAATGEDQQNVPYRPHAVTVVFNDGDSDDDDESDASDHRPVWIAPATAEAFFEQWDAEAREEELAEQAARARENQ